ncbi:replication protein A 32 kDa subunit B-like isoform X3 [Aegilops tauschii subsp. strangulata]|uniref:replication protein A 32 kDa subunit B-like isoform X3 n=1 Tax=Aegilops tauschii subsp. strangulata TaxID=200361 RepID=UPI001ABC13A3|nr:replication protein A 32 kDa subunit B-like isoform X3 [Aegilops tauschii subsp. strangulata]
MSAPRRSSSGPRGRTQGQNVGSGSNSYISRSTDASQGHASSQPERSRRWPLARDDMLVPVTVKMLGDASVTLVARLITPSATGNSYRFVLDDGTGRIVCTYWFAGHGGDNRVMNIPVGDYVDVSGRPDVNSNTPTITVFSCRPIAPDFDHITLHFLQTIYAYLDLQRPPPETLVTDMYNLLRDYLDTGDEGLPFSWICTGTSFNHVIVRRALDILVSHELATYDPAEDKYSLP